MMMKRSPGSVRVSMPSDREILVSRDFNAPRKLVFDAFTKPELVRQWLYGPDEWPIVECTIDLKVGGSIRYVWRNPEHGEMGLSGKYREIMPPERIVHTEIFDQDWTGGETVVTTTFSQQGGTTTVAINVLYATTEARDAALKTGMTEGMAMGYDRLDDLLPALS